MRFFTLALFVLLSFSASAQTCSGTGGSLPTTAVAVCGTQIFQQPFVPSCNGHIFPYFDCAVQPFADNAVWYKFHCYTTGTLGFLITPAGADDYDWNLMDITGHQPDDVFTTNLMISMNLSQELTSTGCTPTGTSNINCEGFTSQYNSMPTLIAGHDYLLCVSNWSSSGLGYDLSFSGTVGLSNNQPPTVESAGIVGCNSSLIKMKLSEPVLCSSLSPMASEFTITNGIHVITSVSTVCSTTNSFDSLTLTLQDPLPPGNYQLIVNNGSDLNTLFDVCNDPMAAGTSVPFSVPVQGPVLISQINFSGCATTVLKVALNKPVLCNTITSTGSEFSISPGNPTITSATRVCNAAGLADTILITLQGHLPFGNYQLSINNGTDGNTFTETCGTSVVPGYQFPFVISQTTTAPSIQSIDFDECLPNTIVVHFDKPVDCNSISTGEFSITPGSLSVNAVSSNCPASGYVTQVTLTLSGNLPAGNFNVKINNGSDANTISDTCYAFIPVNTIKAFTTTQAPKPTYDSLQYDKCNPTQIRIFYSQPIACGSYFCSGEEFSITGPTAVSIQSVEGAITHCCPSENGSFTPGFTNWLILHLSAPITVAGNYTLHNIMGADGNSVATPCGAGQDVLETFPFYVSETPSATFNDAIHWGCLADTLQLSHPGNGTTSWVWTFSNGTTASGQTITHTFPSSTLTATVQLVVSNGYCTDTLERSYALDNAINADFTVSPDSACINSNLEILNISTGNNLQWNWQFGDNTSSAEHFPVQHSYTLDNNYNIDLIVNNDHGCYDTITRKVVITKPPTVDFTGLNSKYCTGDMITLTADMHGDYISNYTWSVGSHTSFHNQQVVSFPYGAAGNHSINLTATDKFCGTAGIDHSTMIYQTPYVNLGNDTTLCPGLTISIGPNSTAGYGYLWSNGTTTSKIITDIYSHIYHLTVSNNGCVADDDIFVTLLDNCLIKVPTAFTPNHDNLNDYLKAINADLATQFTFRVYNRFGQQIFISHDPRRGWDGTFRGNNVDAGTYVWQLSYIHPFTHKAVYEKGTSILIR